MVEDVLVDELVLTHALDHAVTLLSQPPHHAEDGNPGQRGVPIRVLLLVLKENAERLDNVEDSDDGAGPSYTSGAVEHNLAVGVSLLVLARMVLVYEANQGVNNLVITLLRSSVVGP